MPANTTPVFPGVLGSELSQISVANANRDGTTGTYVDILTAGTNGTRVSKITVTAAGTTTAGVIRLFLYNGINTYLWREILVTAITPSTTIGVWSYTLFMPGEAGLLLPAGWKLKASTHNAETFNIACEGGDY